MRVSTCLQPSTAAVTKPEWVIPAVEEVHVASLLLMGLGTIATNAHTH